MGLEKQKSHKNKRVICDKNSSADTFFSRLLILFF